MSQFYTQADVQTFMIQQGLNSLPKVAPTGVNANVIHTPENLLIHTQITVTAPLAITLGATGARAGGVKILDMPACLAAIQAARIKLAGGTLSDPAATGTAGEIGLGTTIASGAVAVLGGTAAFENILEGGVPAALGNIAAGGSLAPYLGGAGSRAAVGNGSAPWAIHLNASTTLGTAALGTQLIIPRESVIEFWWQCLRP